MKNLEGTIEKTENVQRIGKVRYDVDIGADIWCTCITFLAN